MGHPPVVVFWHGNRDNLLGHPSFSAAQSKEDVIKSDATGTIRISMLTGNRKGVAKFKVTEPNCSEVSFDYGVI